MATVNIVPFPGVPGDTGPRGLQGIQGETGLTGPLGPTGADGDSTAYAPAIPGDWLVAPTTIAAALDEIATRIKALEA